MLGPLFKERFRGHCTILALLLLCLCLVPPTAFRTRRRTGNAWAAGGRPQAASEGPVSGCRRGAAYLTRISSYHQIPLHGRMGNARNPPPTPPVRLGLVYNHPSLSCSPFQFFTTGTGVTQLGSRQASLSTALFPLMARQATACLQEGESSNLQSQKVRPAEFHVLSLLKAVMGPSYKLQAPSHLVGCPAAFDCKSLSRLHRNLKAVL